MAVTTFRFPPKEGLVKMGDRMVRRVWEVERVDRAGELPTIRARIEVRNGAPELREFSLTSTETGTQVEIKVLRDFDFEGMIETVSGAERMNAGTWGMDETSAGTSPHVGGVITVDNQIADEQAGRKAARSARRRKMTPSRLREVADVYRQAEGSPVKAVEDQFEIKRRMATYYIQKARADGYLSEDD
jgi:hypothetical protein